MTPAEDLASRRKSRREMAVDENQLRRRIPADDRVRVRDGTEQSFSPREMKRVCAMSRDIGKPPVLIIVSSGNPVSQNRANASSRSFRSQGISAHACLANSVKLSR